MDGALNLTDWTQAEKRIGRRVFDAALQRELAEALADFKRRAAATVTPDEMWAVEDFLRQKRTRIDAK